MKRKSRNGDDEERNLPKIILLVAMLGVVFMSTSVLLSAYPQHLYLDDKTVINAAIGFEKIKDNIVNIRGNQVPFTQNDIIPITGQDYIRITGNQVQLGNSTYTPGVRTVTPKFYQNVLFQQYVGEFNVNRAAQVGIDKDVISLIPISVNIVNIRSNADNYNIEFVQSTTFLTTKDGVMLKLQKDSNVIRVYAVGIWNYENVWMRII